MNDMLLFEISRCHLVVPFWALGKLVVTGSKLMWQALSSPLGNVSIDTEKLGKSQVPFRHHILLAASC